MARLLVTGASGLLGSEVALQAQRAGWDVVGTYHTRMLQLPISWQQLVLEDRAAVGTLISAVRPAAIIHTAYARSGPHMWASTAEGAASVAIVAQRIGARLVHLSSDFVFDGTAAPYDEQAPPSPIIPYGAAKAAAEVAVVGIAPAAAVVRTSLILRLAPPDPQTQYVLDLAAHRRSGSLFTDEYRCPVIVEDLALAVLELIEHPFAGVINVAGADAVNRYELGCLILAAHGHDSGTLQAGTVAESGRPRPTDVRLDVTLARSVLRTRLRGVREYLRPLGN